MDGQLTNAATTPHVAPQSAPQAAPYAPQQIPQQERQQAQPASLPPGSLSFGAIKVLSIIMLVVVVFNFVSSFFWNAAYSSTAFDSSSRQFVIIAEAFTSSLTLLLLIIIGFSGMAFSNKLRRHGIVDKWLSGCSLADIIAGCTFLVLLVASTASSLLLTSINTGPGMGTSEMIIVASTISTISLIFRIIGTLAVVIILFIKARAARQVIYSGDTLSIASAVCLTLSLLLLLINIYVINPMIIPNMMGANPMAASLILGIAAFIAGSFGAAFYILQAVFWLRNTKKIAQMYEQR